MKASKNIWVYIIFSGASLLFLFLERLTHFEFLLHLAAIPLEVLVAFFIVEKFLENREMQNKRRQLLSIKSCLFRSEMRNLFLANFEALKSSSITMSKIKNASLEEFKRLHEDANTLEYKSLEAAKRDGLMKKVNKVLGDGIQKFLDYAIELKEKQPEMFNDLISDYELSAQIRSI